MVSLLNFKQTETTSIIERLDTFFWSVIFTSWFSICFFSPSPPPHLFHFVVVNFVFSHFFRRVKIVRFFCVLLLLLFSFEVVYRLSRTLLSLRICLLVFLCVCESGGFLVVVVFLPSVHRKAFFSRSCESCCCCSLLLFFDLSDCVYNLFNR